MWKRLRHLFTDSHFRKRKDFLRSLPICASLRDRELGYLQQSLHSRTYHEGEPLFLEGDIGRALFIVETGGVELNKAGPDGKPQRLALLGPGTIFGEMALLEQLPRSASAVAVERSSLLLLYRSKLDSLLSRHPIVGLEIMAHLAKVLSARLRRTSDELASLRGSDGAAHPPVVEALEKAED